LGLELGLGLGLELCAGRMDWMDCDGWGDLEERVAIAAAMTGEKKLNEISFRWSPTAADHLLV